MVQQYAFSAPLDRAWNPGVRVLAFAIDIRESRSLRYGVELTDSKKGES